MEQRIQQRSRRRKSQGQGLLAGIALVLLILIILTGGWYILHRMDITEPKVTPRPALMPSSVSGRAA